MDDSSIPATAAATSNSSAVASSSASSPAEEDDLRKLVQGTLRALQRREPLPPTYKPLLQSGALTRRPASLSKHKFYKRIPSRLRERVEIYSREIEGKDPFDRINQRQPIEAEKLSVALTMRSFKEHEQRPMLQATLTATAMHPERKRSLDGMALYLQKGMPKKSTLRGKSPVPPAEAMRDHALLNKQKEQARQWEENQKRREMEEKQRREDELADEKRRRQREQELLDEEEAANAAASPAVSREIKLMHLMIDQGFQKLRALEYPELQGLDPKPFELVIDRHVSSSSLPALCRRLTKGTGRNDECKIVASWIDIDVDIGSVLDFEDDSQFFSFGVRVQFDFVFFYFCLVVELSTTWPTRLLLVCFYADEFTVHRKEEEPDEVHIVQ